MDPLTGKQYCRVYSSSNCVIGGDFHILLLKIAGKTAQIVHSAVDRVSGCGQEIFN